MMKYVLVLCIAAAMISCSGNPPRGVLKPDQMQEVLWDYMRADAFTTEFISRDSLKKLPVENVKLQKAVFAKHKITRETFYKSYDYYESHPEQMRVLLDSMINRKRRMPEERKRDVDTSTLKKV